MHRVPFWSLIDRNALKMVRGAYPTVLDVLAVTEGIIGLAEAFIAERLIPIKAIEDALHIAIATLATLHHVDFLLTWNCRHIANPVIQEGIAEYLEQRGLCLPIICRTCCERKLFLRPTSIHRWLRSGAGMTPYNNSLQPTPLRGASEFMR